MDRIVLACFPECSSDEISSVTATIESQLNIGSDQIEVENIGKLPPALLIDPARNQYISERVLEYLRSIQRKEAIVVAIIKYDAYAYYYNFIFGHADPVNGVCAVYTSRLETGDRKIYLNRLAKEVLHEIGHVLGLQHCSDKSCVMSFSNSIFDVDRKKALFCGKCRYMINTSNK